MKSSCVYRLKYMKIDTVSRQKYGSRDNGPKLYYIITYIVNTISDASTNNKYYE